MQITIEMIESKEFKIRPKGYDQQEVDEFLDAICDEISDLQIKAFAEYSATFGPAESAIPLNRWSDCLCRRCMGATMVAAGGEHGAVWSTCPECFGTGVEGPYILEGRE